MEQVDINVLASENPNQAMAPRRLAAIVAGLVSASALWMPLASIAQANMLDRVKRDPAKAKALCSQLRKMNQEGLSYTSAKATRQIAQQEGLSQMDAEILSTYVVGLHCPDVN